ncbi:hypothetical protein CEB3_c23730 [Peptococcaceae bacterium CEB3]|nr:hypothetical protein CEB3_c23730 [Peptococcaceae bacterium CEB3]
MCKHVAAVLYGVGARLDEDPALFFILRNLKVEELVTQAIVRKSETMLNKSGRKSKRIIDNEDLAGMFGIEMDKEDKE